MPALIDLVSTSCRAAAKATLPADVNRRLSLCFTVSVAVVLMGAGCKRERSVCLDQRGEPLAKVQGRLSDLHWLDAGASPGRQAWIAPAGVDPGSIGVCTVAVDSTGNVTSVSWDED